LAAVGCAVVDNEMHSAVPAVDVGQMREKTDEQRAVATFSDQPDNVTGGRIEGTRNTTPFIVSRGSDPLLVSLEHPLRADLGVEMNIGFIHIEKDFTGWKPISNSLDLAKSFVPFPTVPGAFNEGSGTPASSTDHPQGYAHCRATNLDSEVGLQLKAHQFLSPGRSAPTIVLWRSSHIFQNLGHDIISEFPRALSNSTVQQTELAVLCEAIQDLADVRDGAVYHQGDLPVAEALRSKQHDSDPPDVTGILLSSSHSLHGHLDSVVQPDYDTSHPISFLPDSFCCVVNWKYRRSDFFFSPVSRGNHAHNAHA
jgi:hypothetical protein